MLRFSCVGDSSWKAAIRSKKGGRLAALGTFGAIRGVRGRTYFIHHFPTATISNSHTTFQGEMLIKVISMAACEFICNKPNLFHRPRYFLGLEGRLLCSNPPSPAIYIIQWVRLWDGLQDRERTRPVMKFSMFTQAPENKMWEDMENPTCY
jgi:hypothetical protein